MKYLNYIYVILFFLQTTVQAKTFVLPYSPEYYQGMVESYNSLTQEERADFFKAELRSISKTDKEFVEKNSKTIEQIKWPELKFNDSKFTFSMEGESFTFEILDQNKIRVKGQIIDISSGKLQKALTQVEEALSQKEFTLLNLLIEDAYAYVQGLVVLAIVGVLSAKLLTVGMDLYNVNQDLKECVETNDNLAKFPTKTEISDILSKVKRTITQYTEAMEKNECKVKKTGKCRRYDEVRICNQSLETVLSEFGGLVNEEGRNILGKRDITLRRSRLDALIDGKPVTGE